MTDNISRIPDYIKGYADYINQNTPTTATQIAGMPGEGLTKYFKQDLLTTDFFSARAYLTFQATKNIGIQFGHDKNIIGNQLYDLKVKVLDEAKNKAVQNKKYALTLSDGSTLEGVTDEKGYTETALSSKQLKINSIEFIEE